MITLYTVSNATLEGKPAGPDIDNYLEYVDGDVVAIVHEGRVWDEEPHPDFDIVTVRTADGPEQELDRSSLIQVADSLTEAKAA